MLLPVRTSEQGNAIGLVSVYMCTKKIVIERTRDLIYLIFVATDFSPKIISPSAGKISALLMNPLPDRSNVMKFEVFSLGRQRIDQKRKKGWGRGGRED